MFENYFKTAIRNLLRYKSYTLINIIGLAVGIAAMVWGYQNYRYCFSYDNFHPDIDNVYRGLTFRQGGEGEYGVFPLASVQSAKNDFAGIADAVKYDRQMLNIKSGKDETFTEVVSFTDPSFFKFFNFPVAKGDNDLSDHSSVMITEKTAEKYFGKNDPIGKSLLFYAGENFSFPLTVKGVLKNPPLNSTLQFDFITNFDNMLNGNGAKVSSDDWSLMLDAVYFKIPNKADLAGIAAAMKKYLPMQNTAREDWKASGFKFITVRENAVSRDVVKENALFQRPQDAAAYGPLIAVLILLCSCLNFSNTTVARSNRRLKEIGMRKVMGSTQQQLIFQMLTECALIVFLAMLLSAVLNSWWLPQFNKMFVYVDVKANYFHDLSLLFFLGAMLIFTTLLAGSYPAFYISRFNPSSIFRGSVKFGGNNLFSRIMLGLQISISVIGVIGGIAFATNAAFQNTFDFGYNVHNTIGVRVKDENTYSALKNELAKNPKIVALAGTKSDIGFEYRNKVAEAQGMKNETKFYEVGKDYTNIMNLKLASGRGFDAGQQSDYNTSIIITEKFAGMYGWTAQTALGQRLHIDSAYYSIVGVLKGFHPATLFEPEYPVVMKLTPEENYRTIIIQTKISDLTNIYNATEVTWKKLFPLQPFNAFYQDQIIAESYRVSTAIAKIFSWLAVVTVLLTATGLFALISLTLLKRNREIAVRTVVGATPRNIYMLANKGYFWIILAGAAFGTYAGWALVNLLLDAIYKINAGISISTLIISIVLMIAIAFLTTGIRIWKAIRTKPVDLLRTE
jgi:ABC-type antimicrobial peptide transport system permease subunit